MVTACSSPHGDGPGNHSVNSSVDSLQFMDGVLERCRDFTTGPPRETRRPYPHFTKEWDGDPLTFGQTTPHINQEDGNDRHIRAFFYQVRGA